MKTFPQFAASNIPAEGLPLDVTISGAWLDGLLADTDIRSPADRDDIGRVNGRLSRSGADVVVHGQVVVDVTAPCVRCLENASLSIDASLSLLLEPVSRSRLRSQPNHANKRDGEYEFSATEADLDSYDGETVVLDPFLREAILLEIPNFPLCSETCPGIRPAPVGGDEPPTIDPRMAPLGAFRDPEVAQDRPTSTADLVAAAVARAAALGKKPRLQSSTRPGTKKKKKNK